LSELQTPGDIAADVLQSILTNSITQSVESRLFRQTQRNDELKELCDRIKTLECPQDDPVVPFRKQSALFSQSVAELDRCVTSQEVDNVESNFLASNQLEKLVFSSYVALSPPLRGTRDPSHTASFTQIGGPKPPA